MQVVLEFLCHFQQATILASNFIEYNYIPLEAGRNLNVHKTFKSCPGCLMSVLCMFNLRPVSSRIDCRKENDFVHSLQEKLKLNIMMYLKLVVILPE